MAGNPIYGTPRWKAIRKQVLEAEPICHWCGIKPSTQADHLIEVDRCDDPYDITNIVGSCATCNASRGARYVNKKTANRIQKREESSQTFSFDRRSTPSPHSPSIHDGFGTEPGGTDSHRDAPTGEVRHVHPRIETPRRGEHSFGGQVAAWAERHLGRSLFEWQKIALDGQLSHDGTGDLEFRESLVTCGRQNGKTVGCQALLGWWVTEFAALRGRPQQVLSTAHKLDRATALFREVAPILEAHFGAKITWAYGRMRADLPDGSSWAVAAATESNAHGSSNDLIVVDELWAVSPSVLFDAYRPSQIARKNPLLSMWSTAGDESSVAMLRLISQATAAIDMKRDSRLYYASWSPPPGVNLEDRQWWAWANPALGETITLSALEAAHDSPDRNAFLRAHLNLFIAANQSWLPSGIWEQCRTSDPIPAGGILAVDSSLDDSRYVGIRAVADGPNVRVELAFVVDSETALWAEVARAMEEPTVKLAVTPSLEIHLPTAYSKRTQIVGYAELVKYTSLVRSMIVEGKVTHDGSVTLAEHLGRAVAVKTSGTSVLSSQKSPGPIEAARCAVWAISLASRPVSRNRPAMAAY